PTQLTLIKYSGSIAGSGYNFGFGATAPPPSGFGAFLSNNVAGHSVDLVLPFDPNSPVQITNGPNHLLLTQTSAQIKWQTDLPSDSRLDYGLDFNYSQSSYDPTPTTTHVVSLSGLAPGGIYA